MILIRNPGIPRPAKVDISLLLKSQDETEITPENTNPIVPPTAATATSTTPPAPAPEAPVKQTPVNAGTKRLQAAHPAESPAKKQSKWSADEDALIIELRGSGMKWEDISKRLPGRSAISCRLHYQNYLERRSEWDEDKKNKLARLYER